MHAKLITLTLLAVAGVADARPTIVIGDGVPLDARELRDAIDLRIEGDVTIRITRGPSSAVTIDVGGRRETLDVDSEDPAAAARVVAMVAFALVLDPLPVATPSPVVAQVDEQPEQPNPPEHAKPSRFQLRGVPIAMRDDSGYTYALITASLSYRLSHNVRLVGTAGVGQMLDERAYPVRLGIEGIAGSVGLELGASATHHSSSCGGSRIGGVHGAARIYAPVTPKARIVVEAGGYFVLAQARPFRTEVDGEMCFGPSQWQSYAGWLGAGVEWSL
jgi:hypothetical protein